MSAVGKMKTAMPLPLPMRPAASDTHTSAVYLWVINRCIKVESKFCLTPYPISNLG